MKSILEALTKYLESSPELRDVFGHDQYGFRCFALRAPQDVPNPLILLDQNAIPANLLGNESKQVAASISVSVFADKYHVAESLLEMIRLLPLSHFQGDMNGVHVTGCTPDSEQYTVTNPTSGADRWEYQSTADYTVHYHRPQPLEV